MKIRKHKICDTCNFCKPLKAFPSIRAKTCSCCVQKKLTGELKWTKTPLPDLIKMRDDLKEELDRNCKIMVEKYDNHDAEYMMSHSFYSDNTARFDRLNKVIRIKKGFI